MIELEIKTKNIKTESNSLSELLDFINKNNYKVDKEVVNFIKKLEMKEYKKEEEERGFKKWWTLIILKTWKNFVKSII